MESVNGRVLILDDDPAIGRTIALFAKHLEVDAISVCSAAVFFVTLEQWKPTHIILDLVMPELDGVEVMQLLAGKGCDSRIAISSGLGERILSAARQSAAEHGLDVASVLPKPLNMKALREFLFQSKDENYLSVVTTTPEPTITRQEILNAVEHREFQLVFQPKIEC